MRQSHPEWSFSPDPVFGYHNERTRCAWDGYRAASASRSEILEALARAIDFIDSVHDGEYGFSDCTRDELAEQLSALLAKYQGE